MGLRDLWAEIAILLNVTTIRRDFDKAVPRLSDRQEQCLRGVLDLKSAKQIARELGISPHAVEKHLRVVREKFGVNTSAEAARLFGMVHQGGEFPQYGPSDLARSYDPRHSSPAHELPDGQFRASTGASLVHDPLTPRQTLLTITAVCFVSIVGLLLLVACAEAIRELVMR